MSPYQRQTAEQTELLASAKAPEARAAAAEALGYLRNYGAADALARALGDSEALVRREAALALAFCGAREHLRPLARALDDSDWVVRQSAWVALTNLTGMEWPFDALAAPAVRSAQVRRWHDWMAQMPAGRAPAEVLALIEPAARASTQNLALGAAVAVSTLYKGPPEALTDGAFGPAFWQTKNVEFPQHCTIDLGAVRTIGSVVVQQYGAGFCMTEYTVEVSADGRRFEEVERSQTKSPPRLVVSFPPRPARYVRVTSYATERSTYPTTFRELEVYERAPPDVGDNEALFYGAERGMRALGALGGVGGAEPI
ncbi:MAG: discoidin domain-containing protein, partial [Armatimonadota bacterium]